MQDSKIPEILNYIQKKNDLQQKLLDYLTKPENAEENYQNLNQIFKDSNIHQNKNDLIEFLHLLTNISNNHNKLPTFSSRIEKLLSIFKNDIIQYFSNKTIFDIFKDNKMLLLYLFEEKILICDKNISNIFQSNKYKEANYPSFFYPEIENFLKEKEVNDLNTMNFQTYMIMQAISKHKNNDKEVDYGEQYRKNTELFFENRKKGENESEICKLIRDDDIDSFISHVASTNYNVKSRVPISIYDANSFLSGKTPTLIEYASFFGAVQIMKFLISRDVKLKPSLWLYAIHGDHPEIINILEENKVMPSYYNDCYIEAIKCHHNDIANYIESTMQSMKQQSEPKDEENKGLNEEEECDDTFELDKETVSLEILESFNFGFFSFIDFNDEKMISSLCKYDYPSLFEIILKNIKFDVNQKIKMTSKKIKKIDDNWRFYFTEQEKSVLHTATEYGSVGIVQLLLTLNDIDVNSRFYSKKWWHTEFDELSESDAKFMLHTKSDDWWKDLTSETETDSETKKETLKEYSPLKLAIYKNNLEIVQLLLNHPNIDVNLISIYRNWKFSFTEYRRYGKETTDEREMTPLFSAIDVENLEIVKCLLANPKTDVNSISLLKKSTINTDKHVWKDWDCYEYEKTALHLACEKVNFKIVNEILSRDDINVNAELILTSKFIYYESDHDDDYYQIHDWKIEERRKAIEEDYKDGGIGKYDSSTYSNSQKVDKKTALDVAVRKKNQKIIDLLKKHAAIEINIQSEKERDHEELNALARDNMQDCLIF